MELRLVYSVDEAWRTLLWLLAIDLAFFAAYVAIHILGASLTWGPVRPFFDLNADISIPSWFSAVQLFATGGLLFVTARNNQRPADVPSSLLMAGGAMFIFLSADESAGIHEKVTAVAKMLELEWLLIGGTRQGAWITLYAIAALVMGVVGARYLRMLWKHLRRETLIAVAGFAMVIAGGVGFEIIGFLFLTPESTGYKLEVACEELLEMSGVSLCLYAVLLMNLDLSSAHSPGPARVRDA